MKFLLALFLLSSMLYSGQRQIILGSYAVHSNAKNAVKTLNKQIENDPALHKLMENNSLKAMYSIIGNYGVVSVNYFETREDTINVMKVLRPYYNDTYSLNYPAGKQHLKSLDEKEKQMTQAEEEVELLKLEEEKIRQEELEILKREKEEAQRLEIERKKRIEKVKLEGEKLEKERLEQERLQKLEEEKARAKREEQKRLEKQTSSENKYKRVPDKEEDNFVLNNKYMIIGVIILLMIIGLILSQVMAKKDEDSKDQCTN